VPYECLLLEVIGFGVKMRAFALIVLCISLAFEDAGVSAQSNVTTTEAPGAQSNVTTTEAPADNDTSDFVQFGSCLTATEKQTGIKVISAKMDPCNSNPCKLLLGKQTKLTLKLKPQQEESSLTDACKGKVGIWWNFDLPHDDTCVRDDLCPLQANEVVTYEYSIPVSQYYPSLRVPIKWMLKRPDESNALCIIFRADLQ